MARTKNRATRETEAEQQLRLLKAFRGMLTSQETIETRLWQATVGEALEVLLTRSYDQARALEVQQVRDRVERPMLGPAPSES